MRGLFCLHLAVFVWLAFADSHLAGKSHAFELFGSKKQEEKTEDIAVVDPLFYTVSFDIKGLDTSEEEFIKNRSALFADQSRPVSGSLGLLTKARSDRDLLIGSLFELAHYSALVTIYVDGRPADQIPPTSEIGTGETVPVTISIVAGRKFTFGDIRLQGDAGLNLEEFGIYSGVPASSNLIIESQDKIVAELRQQGYPLAEIVDTSVEADHDTGLLDIYIQYLSGPMASIGEVIVKGAEAVDADFIRQQVLIEPGNNYSPALLAKARARLLDLNLFNSVTVTEGDQLDSAGGLPVIIEVTERKMRYFGVGTTYSNSEGAGVEGYWGHRNLYGRGENLRIELGASRLDEISDLSNINFNSAILFEKPGTPIPGATFTANIKAASENYDAFESQSVSGGFGINYRLDEKQTLSVALDAEWSEITDAGVETNHLIFSAPIEYAYDGSNDRLDPTTGSRLSILLEPAHDLETQSSFVKARVTGSIYHTPKASEFLTIAARASVGTIVGADLNNIPADRRFYAGGGGSVRGFTFQAVGPRDATGDLTGGRSILEMSLEARIQITDKLGIVPFVDAGSVSQDTGFDFSDMRYGVGAGLRYKTAVGPLRLDIGIPIDRRPGEDSFGIYAGIGQAF
ncbi:MAG: autotransporter assembly complex family protein [Pseudomonadota bacterium]